jgi:hypothetical protein
MAGASHANGGGLGQVARRDHRGACLPVAAEGVSDEARQLGRERFGDVPTGVRSGPLDGAARIARGLVRVSEDEVRLIQIGEGDPVDTDEAEMRSSPTRGFSTARLGADDKNRQPFFDRLAR